MHPFKVCIVPSEDVVHCTTNMVCAVAFIEGASAREIVRAVGVARSTVQDALKRAAAAKLSWPLSDDLTDEVLEARLFARFGGGARFGARKRPEPDWGQLVRELRRPAVTMVILWEEYRQTCPDGYGYQPDGMELIPTDERALNYPGARPGSTLTMPW